MDFGNLIWRDKKGWINAYVEPGTTNLLNSQTFQAVGIFAQLADPDTREQAPEAILLQVSLLDAWTLAHAILKMAADQQWGLDEPVGFLEPMDPGKAN